MANFRSELGTFKCTVAPSRRISYFFRTSLHHIQLDGATESSYSSNIFSYEAPSPVAPKIPSHEEFYGKIMVDTCVSVTILEKNECIYEGLTENTGDDNLANLLANLKSAQQKANDFLTTLVEGKRDNRADKFEEEEEEEEEEPDTSESDLGAEEVTPKKSRRSD